MSRGSLIKTGEGNKPPFSGILYKYWFVFVLFVCLCVCVCVCVCVTYSCSNLSSPDRQNAKMGSAFKLIAKREKHLPLPKMN